MATVVVIAGFAESLLNFRGSLLRELVARGHRVVALAPPSASVGVSLAAMGVEMQPLDIRRASLNPFADLRLLAEIRTRLAAVRPDHVLCYTIKPVIYGIFASAWSRVPNRAALISGLGFAFVEAGPWRKVVRAISIMLYRASLRFAHVVFFQNEDDRALFQQLSITSAAHKTHVLAGSGVDTDHFRLVPRPGGLTFLMIARLLVDKGVREYVAAARIVRQSHPGVRFRLVGMLDPNPASVTHSELRSWVEQGIVEYLGELSDVRPAIESASVYVLPSYREGTPRTVLEAMAMGRAIITSDVPGCRQTIIHEQSGLLVPARDARALAAAMKRFIDEPTLVAALGDEARSRAVAVYDVRQVNSRILSALSL